MVVVLFRNLKLSLLCCQVVCVFARRSACCVAITVCCVAVVRLFVLYSTLRLPGSLPQFGCAAMRCGCLLFTLLLVVLPKRR
jgi:hypothetical protein